MTRNDGVGLGLAVGGHVALFALLSLAWSSAPKPPETTKPIEVSLVDEVALDQHAPKAEPPAQSTAPDPGPPAEAPPPPKAIEVAPVPTPPKPEPAPPKPVPPKPQPAPPKPAPPKPKADAVPPPKPAPKPQPAPKKPVAEKSEKAAKPSKSETAKATPAKVSPSKAPASKSAAPASKAVAATKTSGANSKATKARPTGSLLDDDFRKGLTQSPSKSKAPDAAPGATMNAAAAADIGSAIRRQVQPCADRQVNPGPGASRIIVTIRLSLNRDGTLNGRPTVSDDHGGVDDENRRYVDTVDRNAIATFAGCAPLRGLPPELYDVPRGWKTFILRYKLPG